MHTFDQSLAELYKQGRISREQALENATSKNNLEWMLSFDKDSDEKKSQTSNNATLHEESNTLPELA